VPPRRDLGGIPKFHLRGRDSSGNSYALSFSDSEIYRNGGRLVIGRNPDVSSLILSHDSVSRQHATITLVGGRLAIEDRNSGNGTLVNGGAVLVGASPLLLKPGDRITIGEIELVLDQSHE